MEYLLNLLFVNGKILTAAAARSVHEAIQKCVEFKSRVSINYDKVTRMAGPFNNMSDFLNHHSSELEFTEGHLTFRELQWKLKSSSGLAVAHLLSSSTLQQSFLKNESVITFQDVEEDDGWNRKRHHRTKTGVMPAKKIENSRGLKSSPKRKDTLICNLNSIIATQKVLCQNISNLLNALEESGLGADTEEIHSIRTKLRKCAEILDTAEGAARIPEISSRIIEDVIEQEVTQCRFNPKEGFKPRAPAPAPPRKEVEETKGEAKSLEPAEAKQKKPQSLGYPANITKRRPKKKPSLQQIPPQRKKSATRVTGGDPQELRKVSEMIAKFIRKPSKVAEIKTRGDHAKLIEENQQHFCRVEDDLYSSRFTQRYMSLKEDYLDRCRCTYFNRKQFLKVEARISRRKVMEDSRLLENPNTTKGQNEFIAKPLLDGLEKLKEAQNLLKVTQKEIGNLEAKLGGAQERVRADDAPEELRVKAQAEVSKEESSVGVKLKGSYQGVLNEESSRLDTRAEEKALLKSTKSEALVQEKAPSAAVQKGEAKAGSTASGSADPGDKQQAQQQVVKDSASLKHKQLDTSTVAVPQEKPSGSAYPNPNQKASGYATPPRNQQTFKVTPKSPVPETAPPATPDPAGKQYTQKITKDTSPRAAKENEVSDVAGSKNDQHLKQKHKLGTLSTAPAQEITHSGAVDSISRQDAYTPASQEENQTPKTTPAAPLQERKPSRPVDPLSRQDAYTPPSQGEKVLQKNAKATSAAPLGDGRSPGTVDPRSAQAADAQKDKAASGFGHSNVDQDLSQQQQQQPQNVNVISGVPEQEAKPSGTVDPKSAPAAAPQKDSGGPSVDQHSKPTLQAKSFGTVDYKSRPEAAPPEDQTSKDAQYLQKKVKDGASRSSDATDDLRAKKLPEAEPSKGSIKSAEPYTADPFESTTKEKKSQQAERKGRTLPKADEVHIKASATEEAMRLASTTTVPKKQAGSKRSQEDLSKEKKAVSRQKTADVKEAPQIKRRRDLSEEMEKAQLKFKEDVRKKMKLASPRTDEEQKPEKKAAGLDEEESLKQRIREKEEFERKAKEELSKRRNLTGQHKRLERKAASPEMRAQFKAKEDALTKKPERRATRFEREAKRRAEDLSKKERSSSPQRSPRQKPEVKANFRKESQTRGDWFVKANIASPPRITQKQEPEVKKAAELQKESQPKFKTDPWKKKDVAFPQTSQQQKPEVKASNLEKEAKPKAKEDQLKKNDVVSSQANQQQTSERKAAGLNEEESLKQRIREKAEFERKAREELLRRINHPTPRPGQQKKPERKAANLGNEAQLKSEEDVPKKKSERRAGSFEKEAQLKPEDLSKKESSSSPHISLRQKPEAKPNDQEESRSKFKGDWFKKENLASPGIAQKQKAKETKAAELQQESQPRLNTDQWKKKTIAFPRTSHQQKPEVKAADLETEAESKVAEDQSKKEDIVSPQASQRERSEEKSANLKDEKQVKLKEDLSVQRKFAFPRADHQQKPEKSVVDLKDDSQLKSKEDRTVKLKLVGLKVVHQQESAKKAADLKEDFSEEKKNPDVKDESRLEANEDLPKEKQFSSLTSYRQFKASEEDKSSSVYIELQCNLGPQICEGLKDIAKTLAAPGNQVKPEEPKSVPNLSAAIDKGATVAPSVGGGDEGRVPDLPRECATIQRLDSRKQPVWRKSELKQKVEEEATALKEHLLKPEGQAEIADIRGTTAEGAKSPEQLKTRSDLGDYKRFQKKSDEKSIASGKVTFVGRFQKPEGLQPTRGGTVDSAKTQGPQADSVRLQSGRSKPETAQSSSLGGSNVQKKKAEGLQRPEAIEWTSSDSAGDFTKLGTVEQEGAKPNQTASAVSDTTKTPEQSGDPQKKAEGFQTPIKVGLNSLGAGGTARAPKKIGVATKEDLKPRSSFARPEVESSQSPEIKREEPYAQKEVEKKKVDAPVEAQSKFEDSKGTKEPVMTRGSVQEIMNKSMPRETSQEENAAIKTMVIPERSKKVAPGAVPQEEEDKIGAVEKTGEVIDANAKAFEELETTLKVVPIFEPPLDPKPKTPRPKGTTGTSGDGSKKSMSTGPLCDDPQSPRRPASAPPGKKSIKAILSDLNERYRRERLGVVVGGGRGKPMRSKTFSMDADVKEVDNKIAQTCPLVTTKRCVQIFRWTKVPHQLLRTTKAAVLKRRMAQAAKPAAAAALRGDVESAGATTRRRPQRSLPPKVFTWEVEDEGEFSRAFVEL